MPRAHRESVISVNKHSATLLIKHRAVLSLSLSRALCAIKLIGSPGTIEIALGQAGTITIIIITTAAAITANAGEQTGELNLYTVRWSFMAA